MPCEWRASHATIRNFVALINKRNKCLEFQIRPMYQKYLSLLHCCDRRLRHSPYLPKWSLLKVLMVFHSLSLPNCRLLKVLMVSFHRYRLVPLEYLQRVGGEKARKLCILDTVSQDVPTLKIAAADIFR